PGRRSAAGGTSTAARCPCSAGRRGPEGRGSASAGAGPGARTRRRAGARRAGAARRRGGRSRPRGARACRRRRGARPAAPGVRRPSRCRPAVGRDATAGSSGVRPFRARRAPASRHRRRYDRAGGAATPRRAGRASNQEPRSMRFALVSLSLSASLVAQGLVPPHVLPTVNPHPGLSAPAIPGTAIEQVHMIHLPSDPPNVFHCAMTVRTLPASLGGVGSADLVTGKYDALADTFTPDADAAALNTSGYEFGLTLHHSGLYATFDDITNLRPMFARRASLSAPWQLVGPITPI